jgi:hypothetical protein
MTDEEIKEEIKQKLSVRQPVAFRALRLGRRAGKAAVNAGSIPVTASGSVPSLWLRTQLMMDDNGTSREASVQAAS